MNCICRMGAMARSRWGGIHLVDKCLLVILTLLMLQSALNLFLHENASAETNVIDIVVRTSAAGIFGYLISGNFSQRSKRSLSKGTRGNAAARTEPAGSREAPRAQIGFQTQEGGPAEVPPPPALAENGYRTGDSCDRAQILVVASIGILSLLILLIFRNFMENCPANASTISQFRDFVSGSVGFLISCTTSGVDAAKK